MNLKSIRVMGWLCNTNEVQQNSYGSPVQLKITYARNKAYGKKGPRLHFEIK